MDAHEAEEYLQQGRTLIGQENYGAAIEFLSKAEKADKMNIEVYLSKGLAYANMNEMELAKAEYEKALKLNRNSGIAYFHLGNIAMLQNERNEGVEYYNKAVANGFDDAQVFFTLGLMYEEDGNSEMAVRNYTKAIHKDPLRPDARVRKIRLMINNGRPEETLDAIDELILACPDIFEGYHLRFLLLLELGKLEEAEETIDGAMEMFPKDVGFAMDKAALFTARKQYDKALNYLDEIAATMEIDADAQRNIAMEKAKIAAATEDMDKTIESLEQACSIWKTVKPKEIDQEATYLLMNCYLSEEAFEKSIECAKLLKEENIALQFRTPAYYYEPFAMNKQGNYEAAVPVYEAAVDKLRSMTLRDPGNLDGFVFRILCLRDLKQYEKALELADYLVAVQENLAEVHNIRAIVLKDMGRESEAKEEAARADSLGGATAMLLQDRK